MRIAMNAGADTEAPAGPDGGQDSRPGTVPESQAPDLVTRLLCSALYVRPSPIGKRLLERRLRRERAGRTWRGGRRTILLSDDGTCPPLGEPAADWVLRQVLHGPRLPVPSFGFDLLPVVAHSLRARRISRLRRLILLAVGALVALIAPLAAGLWAAAALLGFLFTTGGARDKEEEEEGDRSAALLLWVPPLVGIFAPWAALDDEGRAWSLVLPFVWLLCTWPVYVADRLVVRHSVYRLMAGDPQPEPGAGKLWTPPFGRHRMRRAAELAEGERRLEQPYDADHRFVGAGLKTWAPAVPTTPLKADDAGDKDTPASSARLFGEAELLEHIGAALLSFGQADGLTDSLPGISVERVVGIQAPLWLLRARGSKHTEPGLHDNRFAPSGRPERLYLRARCVTWQGQVTVTMFVNVALEAGRLRVTLRPHVMAPLHNVLILAVLGEMLPLYQVVVSGIGESFLDAIRGSLTPWYRRRGNGGAVKDPASLREHFSMEQISDMHQSDDERRLMVLMESCVFDAVSAFLTDHGIDSGIFDQQVSVIINNIQVFGDNLAPIQSMTAQRMTTAQQKAGSPGPASAQADRKALGGTSK